MVKKNEKWWMRVDFTDQNKCCPKDPYPLPRIDKLVDIAAWCEVMSLLDYFSRYHQICLNPEDEEKTSFITPGGTYCYRRTPEGLQNIGPTFLRMSGGVFDKQKCKNLIMYVNDIMVKSDKKEAHIWDLQETFENIRKAGLRLNPDKCIFSIKKANWLVA